MEGGRLSQQPIVTALGFSPLLDVREAGSLEEIRKDTQGQAPEAPGRVAGRGVTEGGWVVRFEVDAGEVDAADAEEPGGDPDGVGELEGRDGEGQLERVVT